MTTARQQDEPLEGSKDFKEVELSDIKPDVKDPTKTQDLKMKAVAPPSSQPAASKEDRK